MKHTKVRLSNRVLAFLLTLAIMVTMMPYKSSVATGDSDTLGTGIGIVNNMMTDSNDIQNTYKVTFYKTTKTAHPPTGGEGETTYTYSYEAFQLTSEFSLVDQEGQTIYLESDGSIRMNKGQVVSFTDGNNSALENFLIANEITRIVIDFQAQEGGAKAFEQYDSTTGFSGADNADIDGLPSTTGDPAKEASIISREIYKINYSFDEVNKKNTIKDEDTYKLKQFNFTPMTDFDVNVQWRDTGSGRPEKEKITFTIERAEVEGSTTSQYKAYTPEARTEVAADSNNYLYTYKVPEYSADNKVYYYKAENEKKIVTTTDDPPVTQVVAINGYYISATDDSHFVNYSLREFQCDANWYDTAQAENIDKDISAAFIKSHFDLIDETDQNNPVNIFSFTEAELENSTLSEEDKEFIRNTYTQTTKTVTNPETSEQTTVTVYELPDSAIEYKNNKLVISNLLEITSDGTAKIYSLKPKKTSIDVNDVDKKDGNAYSGSDVDSYLISSTNSGVRSNIVDRTYDGGALNLLLTGKTTFEGPLTWADSVKSHTSRSTVKRAAAITERQYSRMAPRSRTP